MSSPSRHVFWTLPNVITERWLFVQMGQPVFFCLFHFIYLFFIHCGLFWLTRVKSSTTVLFFLWNFSSWKEPGGCVTSHAGETLVWTAPKEKKKKGKNYQIIIVMNVKRRRTNGYAPPFLLSLPDAGGWKWRIGDNSYLKKKTCLEIHQVVSFLCPFFFLFLRGSGRGVVIDVWSVLL